MRVLHVITSLLTGGAEVMLQKLVRATQPLGYSATVVSLTAASTIGKELQDDGIPVVALGGRGGLLLPNQLAALARTFYRSKPDVVHCWMYHSNVLGYGIVRLRRAHARPPLITSVRMSLDGQREEKTSTKAIRQLDARLSGAADAVIFNSRRAAEQHASLGYRMDRATVIPNFFDTDRFRPRPEEHARLCASIGCLDAIVIGLIARFDRQKDQRNFLEAARVVAARFPRCRFLLVGRGCDTTNSELMRWIAENGLANSVSVLGERRDVEQIQAALDIAVSSSATEGFPNAVGEAMACGTPCVVTDVGDSAFIVGETGLVVPPKDPAELARAVIRLVEMPSDERRRLGERARERVLMEFSTTPVVERFTRLYEEVRGRVVARASCE